MSRLFCESLRYQPLMSTSSPVGLKISTASSSGGSLWLMSSLITTLASGRKFGLPGVGVVTKKTRLAVPSGSRPSEMPVACGP